MFRPRQQQNNTLYDAIRGQPLWPSTLPHIQAYFLYIYSYLLLCKIQKYGNLKVWVTKGWENIMTAPACSCQKKGSFRGKKAFWLSVGFELNWNLMCGMWNSGSLACTQESTECEGFFLSLSPSLSLSSFAYVQGRLTSAQWVVVKATDG